MTRLFHVAMHFGRERRSPLPDALVAAEKPDAVVMTGDLTMRARANTDAGPYGCNRSVGRGRRGRQS